MSSPEDAASLAPGAPAVASSSASARPSAASAASAAAAAAAAAATAAASGAAQLAALAPDAFAYAPPTAAWRSDAPAPAFYDWERTFPFLAPLLAFRAAMLAELEAASSRWFDWPEASLYDARAGHSWKVYPFCHTFPADDPSRTAWVAPSEAACPLTAALLRRLPGLRTALFSRMGAGTELTTHQGWADLSNHVLRVHMPLLVPGESEGAADGAAAAAAAAAATAAGDGAAAAERCCGVIVNDAVQYHRTGSFIVFDDSKLHSAFNFHATGSRVVLIFDIVRPPGLPKGEATGATTAELQGFIDYFK